MKKVKLFALIAAAAFVCLTAADEVTTRRDARGQTVGTETRHTNSDGSVNITYRNASGQTTGTATERATSRGTNTTYRNAKGQTVGTSTAAKP